MSPSTNNAAETYERSQRIERSVGHWVRRLVFGALEQADEDIGIAMGGGATLDYYLSSDALEAFNARGFYVPMTLHVPPPTKVKAYVDAFANVLNAETRINGTKKLHSSVYMIAHILRMHGVSVDVDRLDSWTLFLPAYIKGIGGYTVVLNVRYLDNDQTNVAVLRALELTSSEVNMLDSSKAIIRHPTMPLMMMPFGYVFSTPKLASKKSRATLIAALLTGNTMLHSPGSSQTSAYHEALKAAKAVLNEDPALGDFLPRERREMVLGYKQSKNQAEVAALHAAAVAKYSAEESASIDIVKSLNAFGKHVAPGRFADDRIWINDLLDESSSTRAPAQLAKYGIDQGKASDMLYLYTAESSVFNIACLLSGLLPELRSKLMAQKFTRHADLFSGTFADYEAELNELFQKLTLMKPKKDTYKDMYVFRAVDLFELNDSSTATVYNTSVPFAIHNPTVCSTSILLSVAWSFLKPAPCCLLRIKVPTSYRAFLVLEGLTAYDSEREVLFPRDSKFIVRERHYVRDEASGKHVLVLEADVVAPPGMRGGGGHRTSKSMSKSIDASMPTFVDLSQLPGPGCGCGR